MRLEDQRESDNVEDMRGSDGGFPGGGGGGLRFGGGRMGIGGLLVVVVVALIFGVNPLTLLGGAGPAQDPTPQPRVADAGPTAPGDASGRFVRKVLGSTEDSWGRIFTEQVGKPYRPPNLVLFSGQIRSGCGAASAASGPFYCPADQKVYLDTDFFNELSQRFGAPGDFAQAYVIAHEVGHHVQTLLGVSDQVSRAQARAGERESNALQVRMELQADCLAGVWGKANAQLLETGDIEEAMTAATAIGDDRLQRQAQGVVVPDSFTHGSSEQRVRWLRKGLESGRIADCDTFSARQL